MTTSPLPVLHALRLSGFASSARVAEIAGLDEPAAIALLTSADGLVLERTGRIAGWVLTKEGRAAHASLIADEVAEPGVRRAVEAADTAFVALNEPFKQLCARWQLRPDGSVNDHTDPAYDAAVVADLGPVHEQVVALTAQLATVLPRAARYPRAFTAARDRLLDGDTSAFAKPLSGSYHDVWMELHQDLLSTLGRERSAADGH